MTDRRFRMLLIVAVFVLSSVVWVRRAAAHGSIEIPASRTYNCYLEGPEDPHTEACQAALAVSGPQQFWDWHEVNLLPDGDHRGFVPDGQLCSAGKDNYLGIDLPRDDWNATHIYPDENGQYDFVFYAWAPHSTEAMDFYVTKDGWDPLQPLTWDTLEADPFCTITEVSLQNGRYRMTCDLPEKSGRHLIYNIWQRDDSAEAFYSCSDVIFTGDNPTPTPTSIPTAGECRSNPWNAAVVYYDGDIVTHAGQEWRAGWWTRGDTPGAATVWTSVAVCDGVTPTETPQPIETPTPEPIGTPTPDPTETPVPGSALISVDNAVVQPNESFTVSLTGEDLLSLGALTINLSWDDAIVDVTACDTSASSADLATCTVNDSTLAYSLIDVAGLSGDEILATLSMTAVGSAGDRTPLDITIDVAADPDGQSLTVSTADGSVSLGVVGDVNCDDARNAIDALFILQYTVASRSGSNSCPPETGAMYLPACDVDGSNSCNVTDALFVLQCAVSISNVLCPSTRGASAVAQASVSAEPSSLQLTITQPNRRWATAELSADIPAGQSVAAMSARIDYDPALLTADSCTLHSSIQGACNITVADDHILVSIISPNQIAGATTLATIHFRTITGGSAVFSATTSSFIDMIGNQLPVESAEETFAIISSPTAIGMGLISADSNTSVIVLLLFAAVVLITTAGVAAYRQQRQRS